jgi:hypothetical protein
MTLLELAERLMNRETAYYENSHIPNVALNELAGEAAAALRELAQQQPVAWLDPRWLRDEVATEDALLPERTPPHESCGFILELLPNAAVGSRPTKH